jgi:hypothetical protein
MKPLSVGKNLVANTKTLIYTVPSNYYAKFTLLYAHNSTSSAKDFSAWWYDKSTNTEVAIVDLYPLPSKTYLKFDGEAYIVLEEGDEIRVKVETGATASVIITVELEQHNSTSFH